MARTLVSLAQGYLVLDGLELQEGAANRPRGKRRPRVRQYKRWRRLPQHALCTTTGRADFRRRRPRSRETYSSTANATLSITSQRSITSQHCQRGGATVQREWHDPARTKSTRTWLFAGAKAATVAARARIMADRRIVLGQFSSRTPMVFEEKKRCRVRVERDVRRELGS